MNRREIKVVAISRSVNFSAWQDIYIYIHLSARMTKIKYIDRVYTSTLFASPFKPRLLAMHACHPLMELYTPYIVDKPIYRSIAYYKKIYIYIYMCYRNMFPDNIFQAAFQQVRVVSFLFTL